MREHRLKIGVSGIRGVVGEFLTPSLACSFAQAFGTFVGTGRVVLGRDTRSSGEMLQHAVACGLLATGCEVIAVGIQPTPTIQVYIGAVHTRGGISVTASHNPPEYNALKLFNSQGLFFNHYERRELLDLFYESAFRKATNAEIRRVIVDPETPRKIHLERVLRHVDVARIRARRFRVALDGVNGAGSELSCRFLEHSLGCQLRAIFVDPSKPFPREAEPRPDTLGELQQLVLKEQAEIGFGQDPDGDRLAVVDENGRVLDNDDVLALVVDAVLNSMPGNVVVNLTTSAAIDDIAQQYGCKVYRTPVGEANVVERMQAVKAVIGGEGSNGGVIFPAVQYCRDSYTAMAFLLDRMERSGQPISQLANRLPRYHRRFGKLAYEHGRLGPLMQALEAFFPDAQADRTDGLKLLLHDGWIHLRASNTEPLLRLAVESRSKERACQLYEQVTRLLG
ncbi:MAG: phosphoglucosamine mutase [Bryobacteraceae bacterium]|nr:phosphoglucosamine mutase [Bryobacteraceae bacterium]MDW8379559.1 phosphoglucosamine mutase [Bryobacterales bacterium]